MRFHPDGPSIPDILLERCDAGRVVFLCGAGVSLPSGMPTFIGLTKHVINFFSPPDDSEIMVAFQPWLEEESAANVPLDQIFNLLHQEYGKDEVNALVTERLATPNHYHGSEHKHELIKRISRSSSGAPQIVTTNFDRLFEAGDAQQRVKYYEPPAFPDLNFGSTIEGVTYLHGRLVNPGASSHPYVLSSADFGRAYLVQGWATSFIRHLLERYTVVMVGYQAEDPPIKYLLQGLNHDGHYDRSRLYAFDLGPPETIEAKWRDRGVTAIAYPDHPSLWKTMEAWADRADDPRRWRASVIAIGQQDPKSLAPHERGQVTHVIRTVQGARLFAEVDPSPHPEWVCVMDATVRSAVPQQGFDKSVAVFDPRNAYGIDDDLRDIPEDARLQGVSNDDLLVWRQQDDNPHAAHRLGGRQVEGYEEVPNRLRHLMKWIAKSIVSPVIAWWAIRQRGLHPRLMHDIEWYLDQGIVQQERARHIWYMVLEHHRDPRNRDRGSDWFDLRRHLATDGWNAASMRRLRQVAMPRIGIDLPYGQGRSRPPSSTWDELHLGDIGRFEVKFLDRHGYELAVPDQVLPELFGILQEQLSFASGLLADIAPFYFETPSCYPDREMIGEVRDTRDAEPLTWFVQLFDRLADLSPTLAQAHATTWPFTSRYFFRKLKLYALGKMHLFDAGHAVEILLSFDQQSFWDAGVARELLFLVADRWNEFSQEHKDRLTDRILAGPDQLGGWSEDEFPALRDQRAARYARYLELKGCEFTDDRRARLAGMIGGIPEWRDGWARAMVVQRNSAARLIGTDDSADAIINLPLSEIIPKASEHVDHGFDDLTEKRPFRGLVKANPRKALAALKHAARGGNYPSALWSSMINDLPSEVRPKLRRVFLHRVARLPGPIIAELGYTLGNWIEKNLAEFIEFDATLGWVVYDHIVDGICGGGAGAARSSLEEILHNGERTIPSRRTYSHAINGPVGMCAQALLHALDAGELAAGALLPEHIRSRLEQLLEAPGDGADHAASIVGYRLKRLMFIDPGWTQARLVPMLAFDHPASEPVWNGFLRNSVPQSSLRVILKPLLLGLIPWVEKFCWERDSSDAAAVWLGYMRLFSANGPDGLTKGEMRSALRAMSDDSRNRFIFWLGRVGQQNSDGWIEQVIPFVNECWPRERRYRTAASMRAWIGLLDDTGDSFPSVYEEVKRFLVPLEMHDHPFYRFTREISGDTSIAAKFPEAALDLIDRATPQALSRTPNELPKILESIAESGSHLRSDPRYLRLVGLVERS